MCRETTLPTDLLSKQSYRLEPFSKSWYEILHSHAACPLSSTPAAPMERWDQQNAFHSNRLTLPNPRSTASNSISVWAFRDWHLPTWTYKDWCRRYKPKRCGWPRGNGLEKANRLSVNKFCFRLIMSILTQVTLHVFFGCSADVRIVYIFV